MTVKNIFKKIIPNYLLNVYKSISSLSSSSIEIRDLMMAFQTNKLQNSHANPLNRFGKKCFSQTDEDGITIEILRRINLTAGGTFIEFGVGNGMENNTLILKALGWKGFWVGGEDLCFEINKQQQNFIYLKEWVTLDNIIKLMSDGTRFIGTKEIDVISLDLDGNDIYFVQKLLENRYFPKLFIVEYNAKFPPPVRWQIDYSASHIWQNDDYFGASLSSFNDLFIKHGFRLICCNSHTGANAFFIREDFMELFKDIPQDIDKIYVPPRYYLYHTFGHKSSLETIKRLF